MDTPDTFSSKPSKLLGLWFIDVDREIQRRFKLEAVFDCVQYRIYAIWVFSQRFPRRSLSGRPVTPDLVSSGSASESSSSSNSSYGHTTFDDSASQNTPPIVISPPRQEQIIDGSTPSLSPAIDRIPQRQRTSLAERLLSLVDSGGRPIRLVKRSALKDITNIVKPLSSVPADVDCIEDAQCLIYQSAEEFLPPFASTPPTCNAPYADSSFFGSSQCRFGDMFSPMLLDL